MVEDSGHADRVARERIENPVLASFHGMNAWKSGIEPGTFARMVHKSGERAIEPTAISERPLNAPLLDAVRENSTEVRFRLDG